MAELPEFLAQSTEELAAARAETKANFQVGRLTNYISYMYPWFALALNWIYQI